MSKRYKIVFAIRFFGYLLFFSGLFGAIFLLGPLIQVEFGYNLDKAKGVKRTVATLPSPTPAPSGPATAPVSNAPATGGESFGNVQASENVIVPVSTDFGIVIEKIDANAKVIADVDPANEAKYTADLNEGVAEA